MKVKLHSAAGAVGVAVPCVLPGRSTTLPIATTAAVLCPYRIQDKAGKIMVSHEETRGCSRPFRGGGGFKHTEICADDVDLPSLLKEKTDLCLSVQQAGA